MNEAILEISSMLSVLYLSDLASVATPVSLHSVFSLISDKKKH